MRHAIKVNVKWLPWLGFSFLSSLVLTDPINPGVHSSTGQSSHRPLTAHPTVFVQGPTQLSPGLLTPDLPSVMGAANELSMGSHINEPW